MNDIFILYKLNKSTKKSLKADIITEFTKNLRNHTSLENVVVKEYDNDFSNTESNYESNNSSVLVCFFDDELFYDEQCCTIWSSFGKRQEKVNVQIVFPVLIEYISTSNFENDKIKKEIYEQADLLGFYSLFKKNSGSEFDALCKDIKVSLDFIDPETLPQVAVETNVLPVCEIDGKLIDSFSDSIAIKNQTERFAALNKEITRLQQKLETDYKKVTSIREQSKKKKKGESQKKRSALPVCVLYTGGTAGMIHEKESLDLIQAPYKQLITKLPRLKREDFEIDFYSFEEPLDSSNIKAHHWLVIASVIEFLYDKYQGFVIIHGANTMAYTASALSFLLDNINKPIILTGSELALTELNNDAEQNIQRSIELAAYVSKQEWGIAEVCILFGRRLIRGNRATKQIALDTTEGFYSPNYPDLASVSHDKVVINTNYANTISPKNRNKSPSDTMFKIDFNKHIASFPKVVICDIYPDMDMSIFHDMCLGKDKNDNDRGIGAVIIRTYGTGGVPDMDEEFLACLLALKEEHIIVVNLTQCPKGNIEFRLFETNAVLFNHGVISGGDMVTEAAYCKLKYLFSKFERLPSQTEVDKKRKNEIIKHYMMVSMHGELSMSMFNIAVAPLYDNYHVQITDEFLPVNLNYAWSKNPATKIEGYERFIEGDIENDTFATLSDYSYISSAVLRLSGVKIINGNRTSKKKNDSEEIFTVEPEIFISITKGKDDSNMLEECAELHCRKYSFTEKKPKFDINIDILETARDILLPPDKLTIALKCSTHSIEAETISILLSVVQNEKVR